MNNSIFSPYLRNYLLSRFGDLQIKETKATCHDCLCSKPERGDLPYYRADLKCCTFHPFLPNYVVGGILQSSQILASSKVTIRNKINQREYTLPLGIFVPVKYQVAFLDREESDFGNREDLLCPYFDPNNKNCGIWEHRGAVCTSYYCASDRGEKGLKFWENWGEYLHRCEMVLAQECMVAMGLPHESIDAQLEYINCETGTEEELGSNSMSSAIFQSYWSNWSQDIESYYLGCNDYVKNLNDVEMNKILAPELCDLEQVLKNLLK